MAHLASTPEPQSLLDHTSPQAPRLEIDEQSLAMHIFGYPSDQGVDANVIALEDVSAADFDYVGLDRTDPPSKRLDDQDSENEFCRRLLRLGGRRWPSLDRFRDVLGSITGDEDALYRMERDTVEMSSKSERRWVSVARPKPGYGLFIAEVPRPYAGIGEWNETTPQEDMMIRRSALLRLATNMQEKAAVLAKDCGAKYYNDLDDYDGTLLRKADLLPLKE
ncbi:hypothetical protein F5Y10DRAFT_264338 [Nemania abortiva]|nr:hypothetical protein F5Y10DRAFT_264338 [Nemania abortiva]